jgi:transcriptional regulator with XRE-family HTH domain
MISQMNPKPKQQFRELLAKSGWTQAEAARQLHITPGALSQIVRENSTVKPSPVTLHLFRLLLRESMSDRYENQLLCAIRSVPQKDRQQVINGFLGFLADFSRRKKYQSASND